MIRYGLGPPRLVLWGSVFHVLVKPYHSVQKPELTDVSKRSPKNRGPDCQLHDPPYHDEIANSGHSVQNVWGKTMTFGHWLLITVNPDALAENAL